MSQQLRHISIKGYKSIHDLDLELAPVNVLIGANGAGKSNFIGVFRLLRQIMEQRLQVSVREAGGAERLLHLGNKQTLQIDLSLQFESNHYQVELGTSQNDSLFIKGEWAGFQSSNYANPYWRPVASGELESQLEAYARNENVASYTYEALKSWRVYHFHDTSASAAVKKYGNLNDNLFLREDASNLAAFLYLVQSVSPKHYHRIVKTVQMVVPNFRNFLLRPNPFNPETIALEWESTESDYPFTAAQLSDGSLRFICIATMLLQPYPPSVVLLDEPELGLHPSAIALLGGLLQKAAHRSQVIVSTQSANLVSHFQPEDIVVVEQKGNVSTFNRLESERLHDWLEDYSLGNLWEKNVIGGRP
jgi:predicted ATPase